ncbi:MAG: hypothetical protein J1F24_01895 [Oscillospiraceae bacterium]|nr:hypothetical protein [Oscillospiraceae bacterium]
MKKSIKLLSLLLTVLMIFSSISIGASAAKAQYRTVAELEALEAYSPYGTVTRLSTEERMSIVFDFLDITLAPMTSLNMGYLVNVNLLITKIQLYVNLTSVNEICKTLDSAASLLCGGWGTIAKGLLNLGILEDLVLNTWNNNYKGMSREGSDNLRIVQGLMETLDDNGGLINTVFTKGLELGMIKNFISGLDLSSINSVIVDLPKLINSIVLPMFSRPDDDAEQRAILGNTGSNLMDVAQSFVNGLFTKPMNWTSYRVGANGQDLGFTEALPTTPEKTTRYFVIGDNTITQYDYKYASALGGDPAGFYETVTYTKSETEEYEGSGTYLYVAPEGYEGDATLKWYKADGKADNNGRIQSSYWLPSVKDAGLTIEINGADSLLGLLYKFAPYIFAEMAPTVLNGSAKKLIAEAFDVEFEKIGSLVATDSSNTKFVPDAALQAVIGEVGDLDGFFTDPQEYYVWEYTDYIEVEDANTVYGKTPYYRYQNTFFKGVVPNNISAYYAMFDWNWEITDDFLNDFIPKSVGSGWALDNLNKIVKKAIDTMLLPSWEYKDKTYYRDGAEGVVNWQDGGNEKLLENVLNAARGFFGIAPEEIFDEYYADAQFYNAMMNGTLSEAVNGLVCELVKMIMPQIMFPDDIVKEPITAIAAVVARELCTQLMPTYDFDAMIYTDYTGKTRKLASHTADEWFDITIYMGVNLGMYYMRNLADLGEDDATNGYYAVMKNFGALPAATPDGITFSANSYKASDGTASWLVAVDWIIDWALSTEVEWAWQFEKFIDCGADVSLSTYQNPFTKLNTIFLNLLPIDQLLNDSQVKSSTYGSNTFLENILKGGLVDSITSLNVPKLLSMFQIPDGYFTNGNMADSLVQIIVNLLDGILNKVAGGDLINKGTINSVSTLLNHNNIKNVVKTLVEKLGTAYNNGLLVPILPLANFFIGWSTDPQKYADPAIYMTNDWSSVYQKTDNNPVLKIVNSSSGMLLKHRNSNTVDTAYVITITGIEFTDGVSTSASFPVTVQPYDTADIPLTVPNASTTFKAVISYQFTGKDGSPLGGTNQKVVYGYVSNINDQLNENVDGIDGAYSINGSYKAYEFTKDVYDSIVNYTVTVSYKASTAGIGDPDSSNANSMSSRAAVTSPASDYFSQITNLTEAGFVNVYKNPSGSQVSSSTGNIYKANAGVTSSEGMPYGIYDMGTVRVAYKDSRRLFAETSNKDITVDFIYYNDYNIENVVEEYMGYNLQASNFVSSAQSAFDAYEQALRNAIALAYVAKRTDYVDTIQPQIPGAIEALEKAYEALMKFQSSSNTGDISEIENKLDQLETNPDRDINFQDYQLFEYFKYENERTSAREMVKSTYGPSKPENYIDSVWGNDLVNAIIAAQTKEALKKGIPATVSEPSEEDMLAYAQAVADFAPATYTDLQVKDQVAQLQYYYNFMKANEKKVDKTFLNREIAYADAQAYDEATYSLDSWARYDAAIKNAKDVAANSTKESEVFDAKYELMVAQNNLLEKTKSMKDNIEVEDGQLGYLDHELNELIKVANAIVNYYGTAYTVNPSADIAEEEALAALVRALGVEYNVKVDGKDYSGILYDRSAITFTAYDRLNTVKNKRAVDAAADKLRAAIAYFTCSAQVVEDDPDLKIVSDHDQLLVVGFQPNAISKEQDIRDRIDFVAPQDGKTYSLDISPSKAGFYGTGTCLKVTDQTDEPLVTYFIVIFGDVNGDGAIDAFDALEVDHAYHNYTYHMGNIYDDAADINHDGVIDSADYAALVESVQGTTPIGQTVTTPAE